MGIDVTRAGAACMLALGLLAGGSDEANSQGSVLTPELAEFQFVEQPGVAHGLRAGRTVGRPGCACRTIDDLLHRRLAGAHGGRGVLRCISQRPPISADGGKRPCREGGTVRGGGHRRTGVWISQVHA